ncbi:MAG: hypothetical protein JW712_05360 [Dehalococcoidales bacterium]|nr:hypothetical protein [Dehalococcoidales bacterium]
MADYGYAGRILKIDLTDRTIDTLATGNYAQRFLGGRGMAAKIFWDETNPDTNAYDPENCIVYITGPLAGFTRFAGCRWQICGKTAAMKPDTFSYANLGGSWGAWLKYAGYDGIIVKGRSENPVYILITDDTISISDASQLWGKTVRHAGEILHGEYGDDARIAAIGPAGENKVSFATVQAADSASGSSGFGAVMGSKKLKAIVIKAGSKTRLKPASPEKLNTVAGQVYELRTRNFEDYEHILPLPPPLKKKACYGCIIGCSRGYYTDENGWEYKSQCQASGVYMGSAMRYYGGMNERSMEVSRLGARLCDDYGLDSVVVAPMIQWLSRCFREGILTDENTGLPLSAIGSEEFIREFADKVSFRKGFGDILADGTISAAVQSGLQPGSPLYPDELTGANEALDYDPRYIPSNTMVYATEPRRAIQLLHAVSLPLSRWNNWLQQKWEDGNLSTDVFYDIAVRYWGSREAGNMMSYRDKALAGKLIQDYGYIRESMILCDLAWPIWQVKDIDDSINLATMESRILQAVTGRDMDERELLEIGERNFNMQRAVLIRDGWGGKEGDVISNLVFEKPFRFIFFSPDCLVPGIDGKPASKKGSVLDRDVFENLRDEYYRLRGWDVETGLQTKNKLIKLGMGDIAGELAGRDLIAE